MAAAKKHKLQKARALKVPQVKQARRTRFNRYLHYCSSFLAAGQPHHNNRAMLVRA